MAKRQFSQRHTNMLKWNADLLQLVETTDAETDRVNIDYVKVRTLKYNNIGVRSSDKMRGERDANEIMKKIEIRTDRNIEDNQKEFRVKIRDVIYNIERIYTREQDRVMEVSLSYAD